MRKKKYIIFSLIIILLLMVVGYAGFSQQLSVSETTEVTTSWDVSITNITTRGGTATNNQEPAYEGLTADFDVSFKSIGDYIEYDVTVTNNGNITANLNNIDITDGNNEIVSMSYTGINVGESLGAGQSTTFTVKLLYKSGKDDGTSSITIDYGQVSNPGIQDITSGNLIVTYDYESNGGTGEIKSKFYDEGEDVDLNLFGKKTGYTFVGWNTNKDATTGLTSYIMPEANTTLYAIYKKEIYIAYQMSEGIHKISLEKDICTLYNNSISCILNSLPEIEAKEGYEVDGWYDESGNKITDTQLTLTSNMVYTAKAKDVGIPTIEIVPNSQSVYKTETNVEIKVSDNETGLKSGQTLYYAWSESNIEEPEYDESITLTNEVGVKESIATINVSGLTGTYYLWIKGGTISDTNSNTNELFVSEGFNFDNEDPVLSISAVSTTNSITVVADATSVSGISKYEFSIDGGNTWIDNSVSNTYTFENLTQDTEYVIKSRATSMGFTTLAETSATTGVINIPTFEQVDVGLIEITYPEGCGSTYVCSYIKNGEEEIASEKTVTAVQFYDDGTLIAKVTDGTNYVTSSSYTVFVQVEKDIAYEGKTYEYLVLKDGYYKIDLWGASADSSLGAYTSGEIYLDAGEKLYFYSGKQGSASNVCLSDLVFNGGGMTLSNNNACGPSGGGATDVRLVAGNWDDLTSLRSRIMVAAGGAAFAPGGDLLGKEGYTTDYAYYASIGKRATQTSGGAVPTLDSCTTSNGTAGGFGYGGNGGASGSTVETGGGAGGGSGYYGGSGASGLCNGTFPGGSGSSYISGYAGVNSITSETSGTHTNQTKHYSGKYFINTDMQAGVNEGDGKAKITFLGDNPSSKDSMKIRNVRYIKDCTNGNSENAGNFWIEMQAINKGINVAKGKTVTGTISEKNSTTYAYANAVDGLMDNATGSSGYAHPAEDGYQCITVDLGAEYNLEEIGIWHYFYDGRIFYSNKTTVAGENGIYREVYSGEKAETTKGNHIKTANYIPTFSEESEQFKTDVTITYPDGCGEEFICSYIKDNGEEITVSGVTKVVTFTEDGTLIAKVMEDGNYISSASYTVTTQKYQDISYANSVQAYTVSKTGYYKVEAWGASGGTAVCDGAACGSNSAGGYSKGEIYLEAGDVLNIYTGGAGTNAVVSSNAAGGYNGGGSGSWDTTDNESSGAGGGATDIRYNGTSLNDRIMVAGGAGGNAWSYSGGIGGGLIAGATDASPGTQTSGYSFGTGQSGSGAGGQSNGVAGAGGGYYGGYTDTSGSGTGAGGSSYISGYAGVNSITSSSSLTHTNQTKHYSGKYFINTEMKSGVNTGNGKAKITYLGSEPSSEDSKKILGVRYIRDCINGSSANAGNHWIEIQAINNGINIAKGKNITGTSAEYNAAEAFVNAIDGLIDNATGSSGYAGTLETGNQCLTIDLGSEYDLEEIAVWHYFDDNRTYYENATSVAGADGNYRTIYSNSKAETANGNHIKNNDPVDMGDLKPTFTDSGGTTSKTITIKYPDGCGSTLTCSYSKDGGSYVNVTSSRASVTFTDNGSLVAKVEKDGSSISSKYTVSGIVQISLSITGTTEYSYPGGYQIPSWCSSSTPWTYGHYIFYITAVGSPVSSGTLCFESHCKSYPSSGSTGYGWACFESASTWHYYRAGDWVTATVCNAAGTCKSHSMAS